MTFFRRLYRISALFLWFSLTGAIALFLCFGGWKAVKRITRITRLWGKGITHILNLHIHIKGEIQNVHGGLIVSNHLSYLDIIVYSAVFSIRFSPKSDIAHWPFLGWFIFLSRPIWVDRISKQTSEKTLKNFTETMKREILLIVFPEGTSTDGENGICPFKSTPFEAAVSENFPVFPVLIRYNEYQNTVCWFGKMTLLPHLWRILGLPSIDAKLHILPPVYPEGKTRKELAEYVHSLMDYEYRKINL